MIRFAPTQRKASDTSAISASELQCTAHGTCRMYRKLKQRMRRNFTAETCISLCQTMERVLQESLAQVLSSHPLRERQAF